MTPSLLAGDMVGVESLLLDVTAMLGVPLYVSRSIQIATQLAGLAVLAGTLAALCALLYRWYTREAIPVVLALLIGLGGVAIYLNTTTALGQAIEQTVGAEENFETALFHIVAFLTAGVGAGIGKRAGDSFGSEVFLETTTADMGEDMGRFVSSVGQVTTVRLPEEIDDVVGYDPVPEQTKEALSRKRFVFPRNLTHDQLRRRLAARITKDYAVGHVDIELGADGGVEHLALGSRAAGIGPTLPPATNAVAIRADPAFAASAGDIVQVWETDPMRRVLTAELRGVAGDVVTLAIDAGDTPKIDPTRRYRLVTLPVDDRPEREFASLLRAAEETFSSVTIEAGSPLHGMPVGALDLTVTAVKPEGAEPVPLPASVYILAPGDLVFAIARPDVLRRLETAAEPLDQSLLEDIGQPSIGTGEPTEAPAAPSADTEPTAPEPAPAGDASEDVERPAATEPGPEAVAADSGAEPPAQQPSTPADASPDDAVEPDVGEAEQSPAAADADAATAAASGAGADESGDEIDDTAGSSFGELKEEFESGDAEWAGDEGADESAADSAAGEGSEDDVVPLDDADISFEEDGDETPEAADSQEEDDVVALDEADISFDEESDEELSSLGEEEPEESGEEDDLSALTFDEDEEDEEDDLSLDDGDLSFDEGGDDELSFDEGEGDEPSFGEATESESSDEAGDGTDDTGSDGGGDDSGGGSSFAQLKEEFESGDADWEDEVSDDPGGDMRLDEE